MAECKVDTFSNPKIRAAYEKLRAIENPLEMMEAVADLLDLVDSMDDQQGWLREHVESARYVRDTGAIRIEDNAEVCAGPDGDSVWVACWLNVPVSGFDPEETDKPSQAVLLNKSDYMFNALNRVVEVFDEDAKQDPAGVCNMFTASVMVEHASDAIREIRAAARHIEKKKGPDNAA